MQNSSSASEKTYYEGRSLPFGALSPKEFEEFVFACLLCIQEPLGLKITGQPSGSGDGGFDTQAKVIASGRVCCIQCKRYETPLETAIVTKELAKVAAVSALEGSDVGEHRIICSGTIRNKLRKLLRESGLELLATQTGEALCVTSDADLVRLKSKLIAEGLDPRATAENYVRKLDTLVVWDMHEFDAALSTRWNEVLQVVERYFRVATVVREHPRAQFDRKFYREKYAAYTLPVVPRIIPAGLPDGISLGNELLSAQYLRARKIEHLHELSDLALGEFVLVRGEGGIGKSAAMRAIAAHVISACSESILPVLVSLSNYTSGSLDRLLDQELGVDHGSWRSLPDQVLLLCDGLNECRSEHISSFFEELRPLLQRRRLACIVSTRDAIRHQKVVLPVSEVVCLKIAPLTPSAVHRLVRSELGDSATLLAFLESYRALSDASNLSHLWTPFSVKMAVALWRERATLPSTLGEIVGAVLQRRAERNAELVSSYVDRHVVLQLASALAFELLIVNRRLECAPTNAGRWFRAARKRCEDGLGVVDLSDDAMLTLLTRHEFLRVSTTGAIGFEHQLIAGSLAARFLAIDWQAHLDCLGDPVTDDAWVFAASLVGSQSTREYLIKLLQTDLILGARAAREVTTGFHDTVENMLRAVAVSNYPPELRLRGIVALGTLGTPAALSALESLAQDSEREIAHQAMCSIATAGDRRFLRRVLGEVDHLRAGAARHSGGFVEVWESAPLPIKLDLARERLSSSPPGSKVNESLSLIAFEGAVNDADIIETHLSQSRNIIAWHFAVFALQQIDPTRARRCVEQTLARQLPALQRVEFVRAAGLANVELEPNLLLETAIVSATESDDEKELSREQTQLISDVLLRDDLPSDLIRQVEEKLPVSRGAAREHLWQIAAGCPSALIAKYARQIIKEWSDDDDAIHACNFFSRQTELVKLTDELITHCEQQLERDYLDSWRTWRVLELVRVVGFSTRAAAFLRARIDRLSQLREAVEENRLALLPSSTLHILEREPGWKPKYAKYVIERQLAMLIDAAVSCRGTLPKECLLALLHTNAQSHGFGDSQVRLVSDLSDDTVDLELLAIRDFWIRLSVTTRLCQRGATPVRLEILRKALREHNTTPAALTELTDAVNSCWSSNLADMIIEEVASITSWPHGQHFFWDFAVPVARRLRRHDVPSLAAALNKVQTPFGKRVLSWWNDCASGNRVGLASLEYQ